MKVKLGVHIPPDGPLTEYARWASEVEPSGFVALGIADSQCLRRDVYPAMTIAALHTKHIRIGPRVTNPLTRHPTVTASCIAAIDELSGGRAFMGIGGGESSVFNAGLPAATIAQIREYSLTVRDLLIKGEAMYQGKPCKLSWAHRRVPIYVAASGPKNLRMAGEIADGIIVGSGLTPEVIADARQRIREGAESAGRRIEDIDIWWMVIAANVDTDRRAAVREVLSSLAGGARMIMRFGSQGKNIPERYLGAMRKLDVAYAPSQHVVRSGAQPNAQLVESLGLTDYLAERFSLAGTPDDVLEKIKRCVDAGADQLWISNHSVDKMGFMKRWATQINARL
ncbi:MAG: LLM class flavin-dependent oxidoreductase [Dehalococcoidia bacterium]|nr:LLM class flavin-dependent oxidoreductase [Dehalococcoidia bacterium]